MKLLITTTFICLLASFALSQTELRKRISQNQLNNISLEANKPDVYITFDKITTYKSNRNETYEVVWLRLHNNLKGSISFYDYDESLTPTGKIGIHYIVEKQLKYDKPSSRDSSPLPLGFPPYDAPTFYELKSGKSFLFGIPKPHLIEGAKIRIQIFYPWEVGQELQINRNPEHFVYFYESEVPREESKN